MSKFYRFSFLFLVIVALYGCGTKPHPLAPVAAPSNAPAATQATNDNDVMAQLFGQRRPPHNGPQIFFNNDLRLSEDKLMANDIAGARVSAQDAQAVLESTRESFSDAEYQRMQGQVTAQLARIKASESLITTPLNPSSSP